MAPRPGPYTRMAQILAEEPKEPRWSEGGRYGHVAALCEREYRPCRARPADPVPGRGGPERRRRPRLGGAVRWQPRVQIVYVGHTSGENAEPSIVSGSCTTPPDT